MPVREKIYLALAALFVSSLLIANIITFKLFTIPLPGGLRLFDREFVVLAAGILPYPVTFLVTDLISELYGRKRADAAVWAGFFMSLYILLVIRLGAWVPPFGTDAQTPREVQELYVGVFGQSSRAIIASMTAYLIAQLFDVRAFHFWKRLTAGRHLWLRNNLSTVASQLLDSILVITILFYDVLSFEAIVQIIVASYVFKVLFALIDTPLIYLGVHLLGPHVREAAIESGHETAAGFGG